MQTATVRWNGRDLIYGTPNKATKWRAETFHEKEIDTLEWLAEMEPGEVLMDIGANVGMYSIAAGSRGVRVHAFEPEAANFAQLNWNIRINGLQDLITAYPVAISNLPGLDRLYMSTAELGQSCHTYGEKLNFKLEPFEPAWTQGSVAMTLDQIRIFPNHIKIDVDGIEHKVIEGGYGMITRPRVKSLLIEVNTNLAEHRKMIRRLESAGFSYTVAPSAIRTTGAFTGVGNHIFRK